MTKRQDEFLNLLADLCEEYNAEFSYTTDDNGIHITADGSEVFVGFMSHETGYTSDKLREAADL